MLPGLNKRVVNLHDVIMYVAIARKHLRLMALLLCFCWLGSVVFYVYSKPIYYSRALIKADTIDLVKSAEEAFQEKSRVSSIATEMMLPHIIERTAKRLGVKAGAKDIQLHYVKKVKAVRNSEGNIEIEVFPYSLDWAKRWSEALVREYLDYRYQTRRTEMEQRTQNYDAVTKQLLEMIDTKSENITGSKVNTDIHRVDTDYKILAQTPREIFVTKRKLAAIHNAKAQLSSPDLDTVQRLSLISAVTEELNVGTSLEAPPGPAVNVAAPLIVPANQNQPAQTDTNSSSAPQPAPVESPQGRGDSLMVVTPQISTESGWRAIVLEMNVLRAKRESLSRDFQPGHRSMLAIQDQIDSLETRLEGELTTAINRLKANDRENTQKLVELEKRLELLPKAELELTKAKDTQGLVTSTKNSWYNLLRKINQEYENDRFAFNRDKIELTYQGIIQINDNAVSPNRFALLIYGTLLGLVLAIGVPFLIEYLDHTLSNLEQVEAAFQLRGLGIIPKLGTDEDQSTTLMDRHGSKETNLLENFRVIRTNLLSMGSVTKPPHVVIVTSAMPKEGKTFVSSNLALSFAQTGAKTLLVDTDLRRGRLHRLFGYRKQPGLSGVLLDQISLDEAIRPTPSENLFMLSAGQHLETGTELLGSKKFIDILETLRQRFDRIVMDTPPVLGLSETSILQNHVDGVLFVIWSGQTPIKSVKAAIDILQANGANFYGFVLNRLDLNASANYYQYYYYSHDYYYQYQPSARLESSSRPPSNSNTSSRS